MRGEYDGAGSDLSRLDRLVERLISRDSLEAKDAAQPPAPAHDSPSAVSQPKDALSTSSDLIEGSHDASGQPFMDGAIRAGALLGGPTDFSQARGLL